MKILNVGMLGKNMLAPLLHKGFAELGHEVKDINSLTLPMGATIDTTGADLCVVTQSPNPMNFIGNAIIAYWHTEILRTPACLTPHYLFYGYTEAESHLEQCWPWIYARLRGQMRLDYGIDRTLFTLVAPEYKKRGLFFTGTDNQTQTHSTWFLERMIYTTRTKVLAENKDIVRTYPHQKYEDYCRMLPTHQMELILPGDHCHVSQRVFECAAAGIVPVIYCKYEERKHYEYLGLEHNFNCLFASKSKDLHRYVDDFTFEITDKIAANAYQWVQNHTYKHTCEALLKRVQEGESLWADAMANERKSEVELCP